MGDDLPVQPVLLKLLLHHQAQRVIHFELVEWQQTDQVPSLQVMDAPLCQLLSQQALLAKDDIVLWASDQAIEVIWLPIFVYHSCPVHVHAPL